MKLALLLTLGLKLANPATDSITLERCIDSAIHHHPSTVKLEISNQIAANKREQQNARFKPQLSIKGKATYQSDVVSLPTETPRLQIPELPRDQYQGYAEVNQLLYDGGATRSQKELADLEAKADQKKVEQTHHELKTQVIQLYFASLLAQKNQATIDSTLTYLKARHQSLRSAMEKGVATQKDLLLLETQMTELKKQRWQLISKELTAIEQLAHLTHMELDTATHFQIPEDRQPTKSESMQRPQLSNLTAQQAVLREKQQLTKARTRPKLSLFAQGGGGYPNPYNFFDDEFSPFYLAGINFSWPILDWGQNQKQKEVLHLRSRMLEQQKAAFRQKVETNLIQQEQRINKLRTLIRKDQEILEKKQQIREIAADQLGRGTINTTDYLERVNEAAQARLTLDKHRIELAMAIRKYRHIRGN